MGTDQLEAAAQPFSELDRVIREEHSNIGGIVIVKDGDIAYENYYNGYGPEDTIHVASVTKSILSALVGIAIEKGYLKSVEQKVMDFFPEYGIGGTEDVKSKITIRHLLTMTAPYSYDQEPFQQLCCSPDWVKFALDLLGGGEPGRFRYSTAGAHLLSAIITRSAGMPAREFANEFLFGPLGMKLMPEYQMTPETYENFLFGSHVTGWAADPTGNSTGGWGLTLTPRDMACFGCLYLSRGRWEGRQIVPEKWIEDSVTMNSNRYGYLWWLFQDLEPSAYGAMGDGCPGLLAALGKMFALVLAVFY